MKKGRIIAAAVGLLVVAGVAACVVLGARAAVPNVTTTVVDRGELARTVTISGSTAMDEREDVYPPTAGTLAQVFVEDGEEVRAGDPLAVLETEPLELQVAGAEAAYLAAVAQLDSVQTQVPSQSDIDDAKDLVDQADETYASAVEDAGRVEGAVASLRAVGIPELVDLGSMVTTDPAQLQALAGLAELFGEGLVPSLDGLTVALLDTQMTSMQAAIAEADAARTQAQAALDTLEEVDLSAAIASARAARDQAALSLDLARQTLSEATMTAPIDGVVVYNTATGIPGAEVAEPGPGYSVTPAAAPFTVVRLGFLEFVGDVDEADVDVLQSGMDSVVVLDAFPGDEFPTQVRKVGVVSRLTATGGNAFPVHFDLSETGRDILIGMRGSADIEIERIADTVSIPIEALFDEGGQTFVYELDGDVLDRIDIEVGEYTETHVEVLSGLEGGEEIVLTSSDTFADGMRVRVGEDEAPTGGFGPFGG